MAGFVGRQVIVKRDGTVIAGARTKSVTINNEPIDVTTDDSAGFRELLEVSGERHFDMTVEGVTKDSVLLSLVVAGTSLIDTFTLEFPGSPATTISGDFRMNNFQLGAEYNDAVTFTLELQSTGPFAVVV